jgi:hypothetical protein
MAILGTTDLGDGRLFVTVDHDPTSTATDAPEGSIIFSTSTASHYGKDDDGETTNVTLFGPPGPQGNQGNIGSTGAAGAQGNQGNVGATGGTGPQGNQGNVGDGGVQGNQGSQGTTGSNAPAHYVASTTVHTTPGTLPLTETLIDSMTITPAAGTYYVTCSMSWARSQANKQTTITLWENDGVTPVVVNGTERHIQGNGGAAQQVHTQAIITVDGATAIEARWIANDSGGSVTGFDRNLIAIEVSP